MTTDQILKDYITYKELSINGRYITHNHIAPLLKVKKIAILVSNAWKRKYHHESCF